MTPLEALKRYFGYDSFRPGQEEIVSALLAGRDALAIMPTGAGKSIVVDAVNLVLGGRAARELIRTGTDKAWVEAVFDASGNAEVAKWAQAQELDDFDGTVTLYREITRSGRNLCRVCRN